MQETKKPNARKGEKENRSVTEKFRCTPATSRALERIAALKQLSKSDIIHHALKIELMKEWSHRLADRIPANTIEEII